MMLARLADKGSFKYKRGRLQETCDTVRSFYAPFFSRPFGSITTMRAHCYRTGGSPGSLIKADDHFADDPRNREPVLQNGLPRLAIVPEHKGLTVWKCSDFDQPCRSAF
jgi:hypothetical protein